MTLDALLSALGEQFGERWFTPAEVTGGLWRAHSITESALAKGLLQRRRLGRYDRRRVSNAQFEYRLAS